MQRRCSICGQRVIWVLGSNISCINENCENYIPNKYDSNFIKYYSYDDEDDFFERDPFEGVESDYEEDYDSFLFYSDKQDYISRYEFRQMNNFIEDYLFKNNKIAKFKRYLDDDEVEDENLLMIKYEIINKGRNLESNPKEALEYYYSFLNDRLFENDYYIYRKLVIFEKDHYKQLELIESFFDSGIYCNRYNYLWFLRKLKLISDKIPVSEDIIDRCLANFRNKAFNLMNFNFHPVVLAEKIKRANDELKVKTEEEYCLMQFRYELQEEASQLNYNGLLEYDLSIYKKLILNYGFRATKLFRHICSICNRLDRHDEELKWIYGYFNRKSMSDSETPWFNKRLESLNVNLNDFYHEGLFFDTNSYYLSKEDFKKNKTDDFEMWDYLVSLKKKNNLIEKGLKLESKDIDEAIDYYKSLLNHEFFKNDYYIYKTLVILYDQINEFDEEIDAIFSFFKSGIYCDRYNYLFFIYNLKRLSQEFIIHDYEIDSHLKYFKEHGFRNKKSESTPLPLSERITYQDNNLDIVPEEEFYIQQEFKALSFEANLFESNSMFNSANRIYLSMINDYHFDDMNLLKQICINFQKLNDVESELGIINDFLNDNIRNLFKIDTDWLYERKSELENSNKIPIDEPELEILYEYNENYLTFDDYIHEATNTELVDRIRSKLTLKRKGRKLESKNHYSAIDFYKSLLTHELFENDYYIYRRLVMIYENINEFEMVFDTIKSFFKSGIYCNRYQYIWFLHKLANVSQVKFIPDEEIDECLRFFKETAFKNKSKEDDPVFLADRIFKNRSSIAIHSSESYYKTQKRYELKEEVLQYELNGAKEESISIFRNLIDNGCLVSARDYMRLCHMYRRVNDYENELYVIYKYLSSDRDFSRNWFEKRLEEVNNLINM